MDAKTFFIVGGSSGIGLEIVNQLHKMGHMIYVGSRTLGKLAEVEGVRHIALDVTRQPVNIEGLPAVLDGVVYCPGTIRLKPFQSLTMDDFMEDLQVNFLGAVRIIQGCLPLAGNLLSNSEKRQAAAERHPLKRIGSAEDVAGLAVFFLSDAARWITGQVIHVDGGMGSLRTFK